MVVLYAGEQWDSDLNLSFNRARYLNVVTGRFWSQDGFEGNTSNPVTLHKYLYSNNDPLNLIDPSGNGSLAIATILTVGILFGVLAYSLTFNYGKPTYDIQTNSYRIIEERAITNLLAFSESSAFTFARISQFVADQFSPNEWTGLHKNKTAFFYILQDIFMGDTYFGELPLWGLFGKSGPRNKIPKKFWIRLHNEQGDDGYTKPQNGWPPTDWRV